MRTQKKVVENGITTIYDYTLHGKLITHLSKRVVDLDGVESSEELHFFYDTQSRPAFVEFNGVKYRCVHNLQGDIVAIVDTAGNPVIEYKYDALGDALSITRTLKTTLGQLNPFRYRGYSFDIETELYYLDKRYYSPNTCRFTNSDFVFVFTVTEASALLKHNLFAYCKITLLWNMTHWESGVGKVF